MVSTLQQSKRQLTKQEIVYPERDGKPMADNTKQFNWIVRVKTGADWLYAHNPNVFVAGDLLWYPVEGSLRIRMAPDVMIAFGRPKGDRGSYRQWEEGGIAPQVVFEVLSPGNRAGEMNTKLRFYERYGVEEYYSYNPDRGIYRGWIREENKLVPLASMDGWVSPRMGIRFGMEGNDLVLTHPDGKPFRDYVEAEFAAEREEAARKRAEHYADEEHEARRRAEALQYQAEQEREQAQVMLEQEYLARQQAEVKAEQELLARQKAEQRLAALEARLRELGFVEGE